MGKDRLKKRMRLEYGGVRILLECKDDRIYPAVVTYDKYFTFEEGEPDISLNVYLNPSPSMEKGSILFEIPDHWHLARRNGSVYFENFSLKDGKREFYARLDPSLVRGDVFMRPSIWERRNGRRVALLIPAHFMRPLGTILMSHFMTCEKKSGLLCHAAAVDDHGEGILFVGYSEAGKSTISEFWLEHPGVILLSDERVILRREEGGYFLYGTPWPGRVWNFNAARVPLKRIYVIEHAEQHEIRGKSKGAILQKFFPNLFLPFWKKEALEFALEFSEELLTKVPAAILGFAKRPDVVDFIRKNVL